MPNFTKWHFALIIITCVSLGHALECYVCTDQEGNQEKCLNTIKTCEPGHDTCLTEIKWGIQLKRTNLLFLGLFFLAELFAHFIFSFFSFNEEKKEKDERCKKGPRNNFMSLKGVPLKKNARGCSAIIYLIALISGIRTGSVLLAVEAIGVTIMLL
ncbi:hypothetical protein ALC60_06638 [Trachymyrmex zeteki]|uniref:Uncharacterized protein n=1 Tax=Mycetomoellerius zeteki TaxID=64791 RepID=A0A151X230_9HYME|nr:hypothetical protein ALC60_06638 [Trachymyrmex zeteki]